MKKNCAFQYYNGRVVKVDSTELTLDEAKELWNENYDDMVKEVNNGSEIEVAIWVNMEDKWSYKNTLIHLNSPSVVGGKLSATKQYDKF